MERERSPTATAPARKGVATSFSPFSLLSLSLFPKTRATQSRRSVFLYRHQKETFFFFCVRFFKHSRAPPPPRAVARVFKFFWPLFIIHISATSSCEKKKKRCKKKRRKESSNLFWCLSLLPKQKSALELPHYSPSLDECDIDFYMVITFLCCCCCFDPLFFSREESCIF